MSYDTLNTLTAMLNQVQLEQLNVVRAHLLQHPDALDAPVGQVLPPSTAQQGTSNGSHG